MNPSKDSMAYWQTINGRILDFDTDLRDIWSTEKKAACESIFLAKEEALKYVSLERERIMKLSRDEAIREIVKVSKIENREKAISSVSENGLLEL